MYLKTKNRGSNIWRENNEENSKKKVTEGKLVYYKDNPDLTIHECIKKILIECGAIDKTKK